MRGVWRNIAGLPGDRDAYAMMFDERGACDWVFDYATPDPEAFVASLMTEWHDVALLAEKPSGLILFILSKAPTK